MARVLLRVLGSIALTVVLLEVSLAALTHFGVVKLVILPTFELVELRQPWVADVDPDFGVWHLPERTHRHRATCFDVVYHSNSYGARDEERARAAPRERTIVLGDSFMEGFGVDVEQRFSNLLEARSGRPHLNFGTSGNFGPTQYFLLYEKLARHFSHDRVLVGLLPSNDFDDDDPAFGRRTYPDRYRPYWTGTYPDYALEYIQPNLNQSSYGTRQRRSPADRWLRQNSYAYCAAVHVRRMLLAGDQAGHGASTMRVDDSRQTYAGYFDFTDEQWDRMRYSIERLSESARDQGVSLTLVLIPTATDFLRAAPGGASPLAERFSDLCRDLGADCLDLLPEMQALDDDWQAFFFDCDPHWNARGHEVAATIVLRKLPADGTESEPDRD
jgi:hypothetical protein